MVPTLCKSLRKLRIVLFVLPLLALMLTLAPAAPVAHSISPARHSRTAMICFIGSICVDVFVNLNL